MRSRMSAHETLARGAVIDGRFRIVRLLASGDMGDVYVAEQLSLARTVALKVLSGEARLTPAAMDRFRSEAQLLSSVEHPAVVRVIDFGQTVGAMFLVMEMVDGETLQERLEQVGSLPPDGALDLLRQIAEGLAAIHERGIVHRDLKPDNVVLTSALSEERARLLDFGIARLLDPSNVGPADLPAGSAAGTPEYMSPEQALGHAPDARADVYAFGVLAYRTLSGRLPHPGPSAREFLAQHVEREPPPLRPLAPSVPEELAALVMRCLAKDPALRPADGVAMCSALAAIAPARSVVGADGAGRARNVALLLAVSEPLHAGDGASDVLAQLLVPLVQDFRGQLAAKERGRVLASFRSPTDAVRCGIALQEAISHRESLASGAAVLRPRVAVHVGEVIFTAGGLTGEPVALSAAIAERAAPGEVALTAAVRLSMNRTGLTLEPIAAVPLPYGGRLPVYRARPAQGAPVGRRRVPLPGADRRTVGAGSGIAAAVASVARGTWRRARDAAQRLKRLAWP
jgi:predicted Ser/Thr protein kinase